MGHYVNGSKIFNTYKDAKTTAEYIVARLVDLGISHSFTVPGDYSFAVDHAVISNQHLKNIINANELNASYAADGYARVRGAAILCTTYAVGELSALNGVMGSKAENNVVFHLVGSPTTAAVAMHKQVHHTMGDGVFGQFISLSAAATCVSAIITPDNARREMNRVIREAFKYRQPAYISIALDQGALPVTDTTAEDEADAILVSQKDKLDKAIKLIINQIDQANSVVVLPAIKLDRYGLTAKVIKLIEKLNVPFAVMPHDKAVIDQTHPNYLGYYAGKLSDPGVPDIVENADLVLDLGGVFWSDFNTGGFSYNLNLSKVLTLAPLFVQNAHVYLSDVFLENVLDELLKVITAKNYSVTLDKPKYAKQIIDDSVLTLTSFYLQFINFIDKNDTLVIETGSSSLNMPKLPIPGGVKYHNQTLWGSIGWATPALLGIALADSAKRAVMVTGEGSHQLTLNELGVMGRYAINPIIFCINNNGFMVERALEINPNSEYDDLAQLNYTLLPKAFGCNDWLTLKVTSHTQLADAMIKARAHPNGVYIELVTGEYDYGETLNFLHEHLKKMYS